MSNKKRINIINLIIKKDRMVELEKWTESCSKKIKEEAKAHLIKIKSGRSTFLLGLFCPLLWWALLTKQEIPIILMCIVHSIIYIIWGISSMKKGYLSLLSIQEGL